MKGSKDADTKVPISQPSASPTLKPTVKEQAATPTPVISTTPVGADKGPQSAELPPDKGTTTETVKITRLEPPPTAGSSGMGKDSAKQTYFTGTAAAGTSAGASGKPPQGNAWLLSKSVPVDVRWLAAGAASMGALYFYSNSGKRDGNDVPLAAQDGHMDSSIPMAKNKDEQPDESFTEAHEWSDAPSSSGSHADVHESSDGAAASGQREGFQDSPPQPRAGID